MNFFSKYNDNQPQKPAQHLAEMMLERKFKDIKLPNKFWNDPKYKRDFIIQLRFANQLLKIYSPEVIYKALTTKEGSRIYSLSAKWLNPILMQVNSTEQIKEKARQAQIPRKIEESTIIIKENDVVKIGNRITKPTGQRSLADKLKDL